MTPKILKCLLQVSEWMMLCIYWGKSHNYPLLLDCQILGLWLVGFIHSLTFISCPPGGYTYSWPPEGTLEVLLGSLSCTEVLTSFQGQWIPIGRLLRSKPPHYAAGCVGECKRASPVWCLQWPGELISHVVGRTHSNIGMHGGHLFF